jgi:hypothetical protein
MTKEKELTLVVPTAKNVVKSWPVTRFKETYYESKTEELVV